MRMMFRRVVMVILALVLALPVFAQLDVVAPRLESFVDPVMDVSGVRPTNWQTTPQAPRTFVRGADPLDLTALVLDAVPVSEEELLSTLVTTFQVESVPDAIAEITTDSFVWSIYELDWAQGNREATLDIAITRDDDSTLLVMLRSMPLQTDLMREQVFMPVVNSITPIAYYQNEAETLRVAIPPRWTVEDNEAYATFNSPNEQVAVHVAVIEDRTAEEALLDLRQQINPDVDLEAEPLTVRTLDDPALLNGLDSVTIVDYQDGSDFSGKIEQAVTRVYNGVNYVLLIETTAEALAAWNNDIGLIDRYFIIEPLAEALQQAAEDEPMPTEEATDEVD